MVVDVSSSIANNCRLHIECVIAYLHRRTLRKINQESQ